MIDKHKPSSLNSPPPHDESLLRLAAAGRQAAKTLTITPLHKHAFHEVQNRSRKTRRAITRILTSADAREANGRWIAENYRLIRTAMKETRDLAASFRDDPTVRVEGSLELPRPYAVAQAYLHAAYDFFTEEGLSAFVEGYQETQELEMGEIWALKPALQLILLERIATVSESGSSGAAIPVLVTSLRTIGESEWKELFESLNVVDAILARDPAGCYLSMDYDSRDQYRKAISELAKHSRCTEHEVADACLDLALQASRRAEAKNRSLSGNWLSRQTHVGFWLIDRGLPELRLAIGHQAPLRERVRDLILNRPTGFYLIGVEVMTFLIVIAIIQGLEPYTPFVAPFFLLLLPATQAAVDFMNNLASYLTPPRVLPKLDFSEGVPEDCATMVAVPTLLLNEKQVCNLVTDLEIRYLANRDPNIYFALLTDSPDSDNARDERDALTDVAINLIEGLNQRYGSEGRTPFYLFHRHRVYNPSEGRWMGWERKRGKLVDLNQFMRGGFDSFPVKIGNLSVLPQIRYVITLDSDTQLPRDSALKLIGAIAHPLNRAVVDPNTKMVVAGYGILQPRIGVSIASASSSRLAAIYSGQTGFDIYTRAVSDVYQDLFGEGSFTGKGIYDVDALRESLEHRFPENALLSHDLIEGAYARAGLVSDIELIDDYPSHFSAYSRRKHRWVRGDWQIMRWMLPTVPDQRRNIIPNPIHLISRWKILDNLRRSLVEPATLALLLGGWFFLKGRPWYWTLVSVALLLMPVYASLLFSLLRAPLKRPVRAWIAWGKDTLVAFVQGHFVALLQIVFLLHQAMLSIDAIVRSILRVLVTKRRLLQWETAAEAENASRRKATVDVYLSWSPVAAAAIGALLWLVRPAALPVAAPILFLWFFALLFSAWLNRAPRKVRHKLNDKDVQLLRTAAERTWEFFRDSSTARNHWLVPDNIREDGALEERLSPTNLGLLLNARVAAVHLGHLTIPDFVTDTERTLATIESLRKYRGHVLNWYANETLQPLEPRFVSTVDSGNLAACLWTLKQAALSFANKPDQAHGDALRSIAERADRLVDEMDFGFLYHRRKKVMSVGFDVDTNRLEPSSYDLLASESRIASFVAIAKGDIPQEAWFHLGRRHTVYAGERVLVSWTGTMFEYLMPALWMQQYRHTIVQDSMEAAVRIQKKFRRLRRAPWGISESASAGYTYAAFGIPELAMKRTEPGPVVISPYSTFLALMIDPRGAVKNLRRMAKLGWEGRYGFYEAVDYRSDSPEIIRSWMAHHQGMSLLAVCNLLCDNVIQQHFHTEPQVLSTELLLHERAPAAIAISPEDAPAPPPLVAETAA